LTDTIHEGQQCETCVHRTVCTPKTKHSEWVWQGAYAYPGCSKYMSTTQATVYYFSEDELLSRIAYIIEKFENPTEHNCLNNVGAIISISNNYYEFDGEKFCRITGRKIINCK